MASHSPIWYAFNLIGMALNFKPDPQSNLPLYRQLSGHFESLIESGVLRNGDRLPATRELAGLLRLNRTTVSAAYQLLESVGLVRGHVGRGSFVIARRGAGAGLQWDNLFPREQDAARTGEGEISFASSKPSELLFPLEDFRATCRDVIESGEAQAILQLGSPSGYGPLRRYLLDKARMEGAARDGDEILITSGVQQAFDLIQRILLPNGQTVLIEDPVYPGLRNAFGRAGARLVGIPVGPDGMQLDALEKALDKERPRLVLVTSNFQNPTGATLPLEARRTLVRMAARAGAIVVENDIYGELSYGGPALPTMKQVDEAGDVVLLRSFSKLAFPGLRVGWILAPRPLLARLTEAKQYSDIHTDQLAQAVVLRFAESGRLEAHRKKVKAAGAQRLRAALEGCQEHLPPGTRFTRPWGGMSLWVRLPEPLDAAELLPMAQREGVTYLPGTVFAVGRAERGSLRISFAQLTPDKIRAGLARLGKVFASGLERASEGREAGAEVVALV